MKSVKASSGIRRLRPILIDAISPVSTNSYSVERAKESLLADSFTVSSRTLFSIFSQSRLVDGGELRPRSQRQVTYGLPLSVFAKLSHDDFTDDAAEG